MKKIFFSLLVVLILLPSCAVGVQGHIVRDAVALCEEDGGLNSATFDPVGFNKITVNCFNGKFYEKTYD